jgi:hypothetical protein
MFDPELLLITSMIEFTIILDAVCVYAKTKNSNRRYHVGKVEAIKKNHNVIVADFEQDLPVSCWCIMWMEISTMLS